MFVPLQANYYLDPAIQAVGNQGELAYLRSLAIAKLIDRDGELSVHSLGPVKARIRHWDDVVTTLLEHKLWIPAPSGSGYCIRSWSEHNESRVEREEANSLDAARKRMARRRSEATKEVDVSGRTPRVESREEKREKSTERTPSGSVRSVLPAAAQRGTVGAAQHPDAAAVRLELAEKARLRKSQLNKRPTVGNGKDERVSFAASFAKLNAAVEKLATTESGEDE